MDIGKMTPEEIMIELNNNGQINIKDENDKLKAVLLSIDKYCEMERQIKLLERLIEEVDDE